LSGDGTADRAVDSEETTMSHTKVLAALSVAMILGAAPAAMAAHKHAYTANAATAQASAASAAATTNHGWQTWCGVNAECNGWSDWLRRIQAGDENLRNSPPGSMN
jgi:hypothetical protein